MTGRAWAWTGCAALFAAGVVVGVLFSGIAGEAVALGLVSLGLVAAVSMMFYEVGLSEDRAREAEERDRRRGFLGRRPPPRKRR